MERKSKQPKVYLAQIEQLTLEAFKSTGYLVVNKELIKKFGLVDAVILSNYIDKYQYFKNKESENFTGWFFLRHTNIMEQLNIGDHSIREAKKRFLDMGILRMERKGIPAREWMTIDFIKLFQEVVAVVDLPSMPSVEMVSLPGLFKDTKDKENLLLDKDKIELIPFQEFWDTFKYKVGDKTVCEKRWRALLPTQQKRILKILPAWIAAFRKGDDPLAEGANWLHPGTFLNSKRWNDVIPSSIKPRVDPAAIAAAPYDTIKKRLNGADKGVADTMIRHFEKALEIAPHSNTILLSNNLVTMYEWVVENRAKDALKLVSWEVIGMPETVVKWYIQWLGKQEWIGDKTEGSFKAGSSLWKRFINAKSREVSKNILTGR